MAEDDKELYRAFGRMESKLDAISLKIENLEREVQELKNQKQTAYGVFVAAKSMWIVLAGIAGAFSDNIIAWVLHR